MAKGRKKGGMISIDTGPAPSVVPPAPGNTSRQPMATPSLPTQIVTALTGSEDKSVGPSGGSPDAKPAFPWGPVIIALVVALLVWWKFTWYWALLAFVVVLVAAWKLLRPKAAVV